VTVDSLTDVMDLSRFDYPLPDHAVAQEPVEPRDSSRLLDTRDMSDHHFRDLPDLLAEGDLVVVNRTRVRAARLVGLKEPTGGRVEMLVLRRLDDTTWQAMVRPARRLRRGSRIRFGNLTAQLTTDPREGIAEVAIHADGDPEEAIARHGTVPLPPYIREPLTDPDRYQTIFADRPGSAAAPTAGLHFTERVVAGLESRGVELVGVELEVGLDTFRPISVPRVEDHRMHAERIRVGPEAVNAVERCRSRGGRVVAIGTTVVRTLESVAAGDGSIQEADRETDLYILPGHRFQVVDLMVTNFHLPRSSLIVLVAAFMGDRWRQAYHTALRRGYRFLSFGDAMLCERSS
jgi:S-adenosylmethionine:tRNA ribosyltransferase-isomerase